MKEIAVATRRVIGAGDNQQVALSRGPADTFDAKKLMQEIAWDIGKDMVAYIEVQYPRAIEATSSTFKLSVRNHIYNQIMAAFEFRGTDVEIKQRLSNTKGPWPSGQAITEDSREDFQRKPKRPKRLARRTTQAVSVLRRHNALRNNAPHTGSLRPAFAGRQAQRRE